MFWKKLRRPMRPEAPPAGRQLQFPRLFSHQFFVTHVTAADELFAFSPLHSEPRRRHHIGRARPAPVHAGRRVSRSAAPPRRSVDSLFALAFGALGLQRSPKNSTARFLMGWGMGAAPSSLVGSCLVDQPVDQSPAALDLQTTTLSQWPGPVWIPSPRQPFRPFSFRPVHVRPETNGAS